jgi:hypothetical protein
MKLQVRTLVPSEVKAALGIGYFKLVALPGSDTSDPCLMHRGYDC